MTNLSVLQTEKTVNSTLVSPIDALRDLILFARAQHEPQPCIICDESGSLYDVMAPSGQEFTTCTACGGTRQVVPVVSPRVSLLNIAACEIILSDLICQGGRRS